MGQKVNPIGARVGVIKDWSTHWYANKKDFANFLIEDHQLRKYLKARLMPAGISRIDIERAASKIRIIIYTAKPGIVIGRGGTGIEQLKADIEKKIGKTVSLDINEIRNPDLDAVLVAENVAQQLERRVAFRRAMKQSIGRSMRAGAKGIKMQVAGRLGGAEIARSETYHEGSIPLQTLRADIDYGTAEANTTYGNIGVKVWIYKGQVLPSAKKTPKQSEGGN
jgi:small subunit ribosomal protein S3